MPRNLPRGHEFLIGYYQTRRAIHHHVACGNSQYTKSNFSRKTVFCSTDGTKIPLITLCE